MANTITLPDSIRQRKPCPEDMEVWYDMGWTLGYCHLPRGGIYFARNGGDVLFTEVRFIPDRLTLPDGV